jgi:hypothetical protein
LEKQALARRPYLIDLACRLLDHARDDEFCPLPILFNLATWAINRRPITGWLIEEWVDTYEVPCPLATEWIKGAIGNVLPPMDGLDEVQTETTRVACVEAINTFLGDHPSLPLVVSSRTEPYYALRVRLRLQAVELVPLTDQQIRSYVTYGSEQFATLRAVIDEDSELREVLRSPLLVSLVKQTYYDTPRSRIPAPANHATWRTDTPLGPRPHGFSGDAQPNGSR